MMHNELSLAHLTLAETTPLELVDAAAAAGFDSISLCLRPSKEDQLFYPVIGNRQLLKDIKTALTSNGLKILDVEAIWLTPEKNAASYSAMLEAGAELGARFALVIGNDPNSSRLQDEFAQLCELAAPYGLTMMLEFLPYLTVCSIEEALSILDKVSATNSGLMVDTLHLSRSGSSAAALKNVAPQRLGYCQICDAPTVAPPLSELRTEAREGRLFPGEGGLPLADFLRALPDGIPLSIEAPSSRHAGLDPKSRAQLAAHRAREFISSLV